MHMFNDNGSFLLALFEFFLFFAWFMCLFWVFGDIFRSKDLGGGAKTFWVFFVIFLPWLGVLVYLIARGGGMSQRAMEQQQAAQAGAGGVHQVRGRILGQLIGRPDRIGQVSLGLGRDHTGRVRCVEGQGAAPDQPAREAVALTGAGICERPADLGQEPPVVGIPVRLLRGEALVVVVVPGRTICAPAASRADHRGATHGLHVPSARS